MSVGSMGRRMAAAPLTLGAVGLLMYFAAPAAEAGIANTKHNLGSTATGVRADGTPVNQVAETDEICVFCHTPHGAADAVTVQAPLWNKNVVSSAYTTYEDIGGGSLDGAVISVGSVSLACLSCHDGTQAMDVMINEPGSGADTIPVFTWIGGGQTGGQLSVGNIANLGTDLSNDHPIGIEYGGFDPGGGQIDDDFVPVTTGTIGGATRYWVDSGAIAGERDKQDMVLYVRDNGGIDEPFVECGSCHDPHAEEGIDGAGATFLRIDNAGSAVCLSCHIK